MIKPIQIKILIFFLLLIWCAGFSNVIFLSHGDSAVASIALNFVYSHVCHQNPAKTINVETGHLLVCARCTGIYLGVLLISFVSLFVKKPGTGFFFPALIIMLADIILVNTGVYNYSKIISLITGLLFSITLFPYILYTLENSFSHNEIK